MAIRFSFPQSESALRLRLLSGEQLDGSDTFNNIAAVSST
jgi:hypothetical protein